MDLPLLTRFSDVMPHWGSANQVNRSTWGHRAIAIIKVAAVLGGLVGLIHYAVTSWMRRHAGQPRAPRSNLAAEQLAQQVQVVQDEYQRKKKELQQHVMPMPPQADNLNLELFSAFQKASPQVRIAQKFQSAQVADEGYETLFLQTANDTAAKFRQSLTLFAQGSSLAETDYFGGSALEKAVVVFKNTQFVECILNDLEGSKLLNQANQENQTPLLCAISLRTDTDDELLKRHELIQTLLRYKADINLTDAEGRTPLFTVISRYDAIPGKAYEAIPLTLELLRSNAIVRCVDNRPEPPLSATALAVLLHAYVQFKEITD